MYSIQIKNRAKLLRKKGGSIYDIARKLGLRPTTVSYWCKDIKLSDSLIRRISDEGKKKARAAMLVYTEKQRTGRLQRQTMERKTGKKLLGRLSRRDLMMAGLGLYWGEGYKGNNGELGFTNSNPDVIRFYLSWLTISGISKKDLIFRLTINYVFRSQAKSLKLFWLKKLGVKENQFTKTTIIKTILKKADISRNNTYKGTLRVKVRRGNAFKNRILGALEHISACA
ncbi:MAG: hypothetical protein A3G05_00450 [Candidatus Zambryskibacteria bacterium RIFCSPLOWO2_12_FULL_45_14]|uniref:Uncharacterized protein n=2 Tax=Candidatus Zambryskiibacteriota TaxID=1817925 RepID=A0A1G2UQ08_9BACT|nr:MAG: hypothetical protein A3H60_02450 [Candidatus Zambryskibacteria bacterium RIFCSPLOWO2_02_FULL_44_12b]OHB13373.1 MAG: hypothetical protein A3G05_00450 [Candidatus Zambryskibacteria bacterium RIFCSPLOWO2_12_FULL_45_14]